MRKLFKNIQNFFIKLFGGHTDDEFCAVFNSKLAADTEVNNLQQKVNELEEKLNKYQTEHTMFTYTYLKKPEIMELKLRLPNTNFENKYGIPVHNKDMVKNQFRHILELRANEIIDKFPIYTDVDLETDSTIYKQRFGIVEVNNE